MKNPTQPIAEALKANTDLYFAAKDKFQYMGDYLFGFMDTLEQLEASDASEEAKARAKALRARCLAFYDDCCKTEGLAEIF